MPTFRDRGQDRQQTGRRRDSLRGLLKGFHARRMATSHGHEDESENRDETHAEMGPESNGDSNTKTDTNFDGNTVGQVSGLHSHSAPIFISGNEAAKASGISGEFVQRGSETGESRDRMIDHSHNHTNTNRNRDSVDKNLQMSFDITRTTGAETDTQTETETKTDPNVTNGPGPAIDAVSSSSPSCESTSPLPSPLPSLPYIGAGPRDTDTPRLAATIDTSSYTTNTTSYLSAIESSPQNGNTASYLSAVDSASGNDNSGSGGGRACEGTTKTRRPRRTTLGKLEQSVKVTLENECARAELEEAGIHVVDFATGYATKRAPPTHSTCRCD